jgi:SOS-response transcriptional repressor LexA
MADAFETIVTDAQASIAHRYNWWKKETAPGSKSALLLKAAEHFHPDTGDCPICERPIDDPDLREQLIALKALDSHLGAELRTFFIDLTARLREVVPDSISKLSSQSIMERIETDWLSIRDVLLDDSFATLTAAYNPLIAAVTSRATLLDSAPVDVLPSECDDAFASSARSYCDAATKARLALDILRWSADRFQPFREDLHAIMTDPGGSGTVLISQLSKGKDAAAIVKPLATVLRALAGAKKTQQAIERSATQLAVLDSLKEPLNQLKLLSKYAERAVRAEFDAIKDTTAANLGHMYPETSTGMRPGKLKLGTGKNKTVEAILSGSTFDAPGRYFANAGLQRAIALAFYFALLERHRCGLGFILMDDPILSLDEDHRERWSAHVLRPKLSDLQVILATHQRQFLLNCARDFDADLVAELNPRDRERRISWKPGNRLKRAVQQHDQGDYREAATTLRKFTEDVLISLDAYSPDAFFDESNLVESANRYERLPAHHPLAGEPQRKISKRLRCIEVTCVLNPGSHSMTEADVTNAMVTDCLRALQVIDITVANELQRLDRLRTRSLRATSIAATVLSFPQLAERVSWSDDIDFPLIGAAAAKSNPWSVEFTEETGHLRFATGAAVQVSCDSLEPVARFGQWVLLAEEHQSLSEGDLVAVRDQDGGSFLRRIWSEGRDWILQSINPVRPLPSITINKRHATVRKIVGVLYGPLGSATAPPGVAAEWLPCSSLDAVGALTKCRAIDVQGDSLDPLARDGQKVLVNEPLTDRSECTEGELAVIEFTDETMGSVIKQVFPDKKQWTLVSLNPIDRLAPIIVKPDAIRAIWPLQGVLFEAMQA